MAHKPSSPVYYPEEWKPSTQDWCVTQLKMTKFSYVWTITNFTTCSKMRESLKSSDFPVSGNIRWCLRLNLNDRDKSYDIKLILVYALVSHTRAEVKFFFLNSKGEKVNFYEPQTSQYYVCGQEDASSHQRFTKDYLTKNHLLSGDKLTILAEVSVIVDRINKTSQTYIANFKDPECKLIENFQSILEKGKFCDVTLVVDGYKLQAHKAILAARSIVFAAMFDHQMEESDKNTVKITDITYKALKEMLHFIYTGKSPNIDQMALDLLPAADKYALRKLKSMSEVALYRTLTPETAAETLVLADLHHAKQLKTQTINFIKTYASSVQKTQGWQNFVKEHQKLLSETGLEKSSDTF